MNLYSKYKSAILTGSKLDQMIFIFDEIMKLIYQAKKCADARDHEGKYKHLTKASDVFYEMHASLNVEELPKETLFFVQFLVETLKKLHSLHTSSSTNEDYDNLLDSIRQMRDLIASTAQE